MGIGDHELDASKPTASQLAQEGGPEGFGLRRPDIHAQHLAAAIAVDADGNDHRDRDDPAVLADLHIGGVDPQVGPVPLDRPVEEGVDSLVDVFTQAAHLALGDAIHPQRLHQIIDRAGRDALDVSLLDHRSQRLLSHPARFQKAGEVASLPELGDAQLNGPGARLPVTLAVTIALNKPRGRLLAVASTRQAADFHLHQPLGSKGDHIAQNIGVRGLLDQRAQVHHGIGHRGSFHQVRVFQPKPIRKSR